MHHKSLLAFLPDGSALPQRSSAFRIARYSVLTLGTNRIPLRTSLPLIYVKDLYALRVGGITKNLIRCIEIVSVEKPCELHILSLFLCIKYRYCMTRQKTYHYNGWNGV
jgi:hypothetical protein